MAFSFTPQQPQQPSPFQAQPQHQQSPIQLSTSPLFHPQQFQQQQQRKLFLFTNDKTPATNSTKWADLHPNSRKFLLQIEERILKYRDESQRLDQSSRLFDSSVSNDGFELDVSRIVKELGGISTAMARQKAILLELMVAAKDMLRNSEIAVRAFMMMCPRFLHVSAGGASNATATSLASGGIVAPTASGQPVATSLVPIFDFYSGIPKKPSPFLQQTVARFEKYLSECHQWIKELEQFFLDPNRDFADSSSLLLQSLPKVMKNLHDFFIHVTAKVESIHRYIESMKTAYLSEQHHRGDGNNPFLEADRQEMAKKEAATQRVHPTLHLPAVSQPLTQVTGLSACTATSGASSAPHTSAFVPSASSRSEPSLFGTPSATTTPPSFVSTPSTSVPVSALFGSSGAATQTSLFGSPSTSTPAVGNTAPLFGSTPSAGVSSFSTPFASGAATESGASFGTLSKARAKSRTG